MSTELIDKVKSFLRTNTINTHNVDTAFAMNMKRGYHAKKTIDANRTNQNYYRTKDVQTPLLDHYENVDWYERETKYDLDKYIEHM